MIEFRVEGPFEIEPIHGLGGGRLIEMTSVEKFWADDAKVKLADAVGCYIFGFRAGRGLLPFYVGQSKTGFKHECFDHHKLTHYNTGLAQRIRGTPIMFFVVKDKGSTNAFQACIDQVEHLLIQFAITRNPRLLNSQLADWAIHGVYRDSLGRPSESARELRQCLGLDVYIHHEEDEGVDIAALQTQAKSQEQAVSMTERLIEPQPSTAGTPVPDTQGNRPLNAP